MKGKVFWICEDLMLSFWAYHVDRWILAFRLQRLLLVCAECSIKFQFAQVLRAEYMEINIKTYTRLE